MLSVSAGRGFGTKVFHYSFGERIEKKNQPLACGGSHRVLGDCRIRTIRATGRMNKSVKAGQADHSV